MKYIVLDLIKEKPRYGYEIMQALEERSQGMYAPSAGAVYPTLQMLEEMGYIGASQSEGKRIYSITDEGRRFITEQGEHTEEVKGRIQDHWDSAHVGERRKVMNQVRELWQLIGQEFPDITSEKRQHISKILERTRREIQVAIGKSQK
ncbi:MAG TPA: PadR family transcriptional regulator [Dehalococcoidales bacterium]